MELAELIQKTMEELTKRGHYLEEAYKKFPCEENKGVIDGYNTTCAWVEEIANRIALEILLSQS